MGRLSIGISNPQQVLDCDLCKMRGLRVLDCGILVGEVALLSLVKKLLFCLSYWNTENTPVKGSISN